MSLTCERGRRVNDGEMDLGLQAATSVFKNRLYQYSLLYSHWGFVFHFHLDLLRYIAVCVRERERVFFSVRVCAYERVKVFVYVRRERKKREIRD